MTTARLFFDKSKTKKLPTADELLDNLRDKCTSLAERDKVLAKLAESNDGRLVVAEAHHVLLSSYLIYQRLRDQLMPTVDLAQGHKFDAQLTIEIIQEMQTCLGRYLIEERKRLIEESAQAYSNLKA